MTRFEWPTDVPVWQRTLCRLLLRRRHLSEASELLSDVRFDEEEQAALKVYLMGEPLAVRLELEAGLMVLAAALLHHHEQGRVTAPLPMVVVSAAFNRLCASDISSGIPQREIGQDIAVLLEMLHALEPDHWPPPVPCDAADVLPRAQACVPACRADLQAFLQTTAHAALLDVPLDDMFMMDPAGRGREPLCAALDHGRTFPDVAPQTLAAMRVILSTQPSDDAEGAALSALQHSIRLRLHPHFLPGDVPHHDVLAQAANCWRIGTDGLGARHRLHPAAKHLQDDLLAYARRLDARAQRRPLLPAGVIPKREWREVRRVAQRTLDELSVLAHQGTVTVPAQVLLLDEHVPAQRLAMHLIFMRSALSGPAWQWHQDVHTLRQRLGEQPIPAMSPLEVMAFYEALPLLHHAILAAMALIRLDEERGCGVGAARVRELLAAAATGLAQLRKAARLGLPVSRDRATMEELLKVVWREEGCPVVAWLFASAGPEDDERAAWEERLRWLTHPEREQLPETTFDDPTWDTPPELPLAVLGADALQDRTEDADEVACEPFSADRSGRLVAQNDAQTSVLRALAGKTLVLLGGIPKPQSKQRLIEALGLKDVDWIPSTQYDHGLQAEAHLRDPTVAAVVFALRWAGHAHGSIRQRAWALGIPAVSLPGGYNPRQILHQLTVQCSHRLEHSA